MTKNEAHKIINDLLDNTSSLSTFNRYESLSESGYPEIAEVYRTFVLEDRSSRWFYEEAEKALVVGHSKLGRALK